MCFSSSLVFPMQTCVSGGRVKSIRAALKAPFGTFWACPFGPGGPSRLEGPCGPGVPFVVVHGRRRAPDSPISSLQRTGAPTWDSKFRLASRTSPSSTPRSERSLRQSAPSQRRSRSSQASLCANRCANRCEARSGRFFFHFKSHSHRPNPNIFEPVSGGPKTATIEGAPFSAAKGIEGFGVLAPAASPLWRSRVARSLHRPRCPLRLHAVQKRQC